MACNTCNTKFNFFHKEMGCANCGMSFCNKCLKQKCKIPTRKSGVEFNVCRICFNKLTTMNEPPDSSNFAPPDSFLKRLENHENPSRPPITVYKHNQKIKVGNLTPADQKLVERLEKLKDDKNKSPPPSEIELRKRLANLKGENYIETQGKNLLPQDSRTDQEKADDLLQKFVSEREIELQHNPQEEIEARLATLREKGVRPNEGAYVSNLHDSDDDSEEEIKKITRKIMDEVALERAAHPQLSNKNSNTSDKSDKSLEQWCALCDKDPKFRCFNHVAYDTGPSRDDNVLRHFLIERDINLLRTSEDIEQRLADLRDQVVETSSSDGPLLSSLQDSSYSNSVDFNVSKVMNEVTLDVKTGNVETTTAEISEDSDEVLPWCVLCNDDAIYKCLDCGGDLYCAKCHKDVHKKWDHDHKVVPFKRK